MLVSSDTCEPVDHSDEVEDLEMLGSNDVTTVLLTLAESEG